MPLRSFVVAASIVMDTGPDGPWHVVDLAPHVGLNRAECKWRKVLVKWFVFLNDGLNPPERKWRKVVVKWFVILAARSVYNTTGTFLKSYEFVKLKLKPQ